MYDVAPIKSNVLGAHQWPAWGSFKFLYYNFLLIKIFMTLIL